MTMSEPRNPSILVLDDNLLFSAGLMTALKRLGLGVAIVDAPARALPRARELQPVAILINLAARALDSPTRVRELKAEPTLSAVPVLGYCGHMETVLIAAGRAAGCDIVVANSAISGSLDDVLRRAGVPLPDRDA
jgi:CheY-like chemotaxis protein